jgi:hypothetical protein
MRKEQVKREKMGIYICVNFKIIHPHFLTQRRKDAEDGALLPDCAFPKKRF